ncbi:hypothetical protein [Marinobacter flavimaris]|uniref:hypothetical protein n=1 Tax=Marinobacter flavimaris TaxID=262076 RepID=UPI003870B4F9
MTTEDRQNQPRPPLSIGLVPFGLKINDYIERKKDLLGQVGQVFEVPRPRLLLGAVLKRMSTGQSPRLFDVIILNWRENLLCNKNCKLSYKGILEYLCTLLVFKLACQKLIYVRHNRHPHNLRTIDRDRARRIIDIAQNLASAVVVHAPPHALQLNPKLRYIPHPLYPLIFDEQKNPEPTRNDEFIIFGRIERYKRILELAKSWDLQSRLSILGPCTDEEYLNELRIACQDRDIDLEPKFQDENIIADRIRRCKGVIIGNDTSSMLVSGSFFFSLSCGTPVYAVNSDFFKWLEETPIAPYLIVRGSFSELIDAIRTNDTKQYIQSEISDVSKMLFGDTKIITAWKELLDDLNGNYPL